ncbi:MAG TPA: cytochrome c-type biogenesis protein [Acidimicrobiia bacterium]|nr:cytochrome c-type biogenesis protein [Acidimicrobiia bacterium]
MIRRLLPALALAAVVVTALVIGGAGRGGERSAGARTLSIAEDLRCPVCQGLSVADSHSPTAEAMKEDIRRQVDSGASDSDIRASYVARYGEWILLRPETSGVGALVWVLPVSALLVGGGGLAFAFRRWRRQPTLSASDDDRALVDAALARQQAETQPGAAS